MHRSEAMIVLRSVVPPDRRKHMPISDFAIGKPAPQSALDLFRRGPKRCFGDKRYSDLNLIEQMALYLLVRRFVCWVKMRLIRFRNEESEARRRWRFPIPVKDTLLVTDEKVLKVWLRYLGF